MQDEGTTVRAYDYTYVHPADTEELERLTREAVDAGSGPSISLLDRGIEIVAERNLVVWAGPGFFLDWVVGGDLPKELGRTTERYVLGSA